MGNNPAMTNSCLRGQFCHVNGKNINKFGSSSSFPKTTVRNLASSSVQLVNSDAQAKKVASGVLIAPQVILCAAHSLEMLSPRFKILMCYECNAATAPPGAFYEYERQHRQWPACTCVADNPQATEVRVLEQSGVSDLDYAMVLISWDRVESGNVVKLPRVPGMPGPGMLYGLAEGSEEMLLIGHPWGKTTMQGEPTQACAFKLIKIRGPNCKSGQGTTHGYGEFYRDWGEGFSGGGVFNKSGKLVGLLQGSPMDSLKPAFQRYNWAFLHLWLAAQITENDPTRGRLMKWFRTGDPLKPADNVGPNPAFQQI